MHDQLPTNVPRSPPITPCSFPRHRGRALLFPVEVLHDRGTPGPAELGSSGRDQRPLRNSLTSNCRRITVLRNLPPIVSLTPDVCTQYARGLQRARAGDLDSHLAFSMEYRPSPSDKNLGEVGNMRLFVVVRRGWGEWGVMRGGFGESHPRSSSECLRDIELGGRIAGSGHDCIIKYNKWE